MLVDRIHARRSSVIDPSSPPNAGLLTAALGALTPDWLAYTGHAGFVERLRFHWMEQALKKEWTTERARTFGGISENEARRQVTYARMHGFLA
jgi:hypothetical protein